MQGLLSLNDVALRASMSTRFIRKHLTEIPHYRSSARGKIWIDWIDFQSWVRRLRVEIRQDDPVVEILRDRWGVPHVYAQDVHDLYLAEGFCHAQDRLWQMEFNRRLCSGRLSDVLGPDALEVDRFMRRIGMHRSARRDEQTA